MAAKLIALAVLFVAALSIVSEAPATTATVTIIEESSENMYGGRMCHDQFRLANELSHCQDMVMEMCGQEGCQGGTFGFGGTDTESCHGGRCPGMGGVMEGEGSYSGG